MEGALLLTTLALGAIAALAIVALRALGRRGARAGGMRLAARLPLEPRRSLVVVEIAGRWLVLGVGDGAPSLVVELDAAEARARFDAPAPSPASALSQALARVLLK